MLNKNACQLGTNLALMLLEKNRDLTPARGTLLHELVNTSYRSINPNTMPETLEFLPSYISDCSQGFFQDEKNGQKAYQCSSHDALMDNYIETISKLVANHVQYARSVVYPKVQYLAEAVTAALKQHEVQQPEDFFSVSVYCLPEVFSSELVEDEVLGFSAGSAANHVMNFGEAVTDGFDLLAYLKTGDTDKDALIANWFGSVEPDKLNGYLFGGKPHLEAALALHELIEYSFINFLFYRSLAFRQDLTSGLSVIQLVTRASDNRDYFARSLRAGLESYKLQIKQGVILSASSDVAFSYLSNKRFGITLYQESFEKAAAEGATIEQVFGFISQYASVGLTAEMLKNEGANYAAAWNTVRGLYLTHITSHRDSALKMALKLNVTEAIYHNLSEEETAFFQESPGFEQETAKMVNAYVDNLDTGCLERTQDIYIDLIAGIAYRHSSAARIIREMVSLMKEDTTIESSQAALLSTVKYVTDYLIEELSVTN